MVALPLCHYKKGSMMPVRFRSNKSKLIIILSVLLASIMAATSSSLAQGVEPSHFEAIIGVSDKGSSLTQSHDVQADGASTRAAATEQSVPGSRDSTASRAATSTAVASATASSTALASVANVTGQVSLSVDALGTNQASGVIQVSKAAGATVRQAWMFAAGTATSGYTPVDGDITLDGKGVSWDPTHTISNAIGSGNVAGEVTSLVKQKIDAAPAGRVDITAAEANPNSIDGEILAVIFDDPTVSTNNSIALLYGAQQPLGDSFTANFAGPIDTSNPNLKV